MLISSHAFYLHFALHVVDEWGSATIFSCVLVQAMPPLGHLQDLVRPQDLGSSLRLASRSVCQYCLAL